MYENQNFDEASMVVDKSVLRTRNVDEGKNSAYDVLQPDKTSANLLAPKSTVIGYEIIACRTS
jgi:hypothetical protein